MGGRGSGRLRKKAEELEKQQAREEEEEEEAVGEEEEDDEELEDEEDYDDEDEEECWPKLAEGYYEIEHVRKKRVSKGKVLYFIKWRGWPETANTWEPVENLQSCTDMIEAFEQRSKSRSRRRKRKHSSQSKKKLQHQHSTPEPVSFPFLEPTQVAEAAQSAGQLDKEANRETHNNDTSVEIPNENELRTTSVNSQHNKAANQVDHTVNELNQVSNDNVADATPNANVAGLEDGLPNGETTQHVETNRSKGAKRRKSGSVKRFKPDPASYKYDETQNTTPSINEGIDKSQVPGVQNAVSTGDDATNKNQVDDSINTPSITRLIKPITFDASISNSEQDVSITFQAMRSDGTEVYVDNKFLKLNDPLLLIKFYEQHLRYNPM